MSEDTKLQQLIINTLSPEQMPEVLSDTEIYLVEDDAEYATVEELATKQDIINDLTTIRNNAFTGAELAPQVAVNTQRIEDLTTAKFPNVVIIGTPHIEGGQVSNYSDSSYLQFPFVDISRGQPFDIYFSFTTSNDVTTQQNILDSYFGIALAIQNGKGIMALSSNGSNWDIGTSTGTNALLPNTTYYVKYSWTGSAYSAALSTNDEVYVPDMNLTSSLSPHKTTIFIGGSPNLFGPSTAHPFKGTINFNKSKVVVNGITVWEGMADVGISSRANVSLSNLDEAGEYRFDVKQDKLIAGSGISLDDNIAEVKLFNKEAFTVVGNPTITSDGVASGFDNGGLQCPISFDKPFNIKMLFIYNFWGSKNNYILISEKRGFQFFIDSNNVPIIYAGTTAWGTDILKVDNLPALTTNVEHNVEFIFDGSVYKINIDNQEVVNVTKSALILSDTILNIGRYTTTQFLNGSIDLKQFSITVDGVEVFNGTQTIYTALDKKGTVKSINNTSPDANGNITLSIPSQVTESTVSGWGFTKNTGTITGIKMNGASKGTSGEVDLGTVITSHQSLDSCVKTSGNQTVSGVKTFTGTPVFQNSNLGGQLTVTRSGSDNYSEIRYHNSSGNLGAIGVSSSSTKRPYFTADNNTYRVLVRGSAGTNTIGTAAIGSSNQPVYINAEGIATACSKADLASLSFPSSKYIDLTLGASGSTYTAPANGWVIFTAHGNGYINLQQDALSINNTLDVAGNWYSVLLPVKKGSFIATYTNITKTAFRFIYAEGEQ